MTGMMNIKANEKPKTTERIIRFTFETAPDLIGRFQLNRLKEYAIIQNEALLNLFGYKILYEESEILLNEYEKKLQKARWKDVAIKVLAWSTISISVCFLGLLIPIIVWFSLPQNR